MKKLIFSILLLSGCSKVPSGNVGVKVYLLGSQKGVDHEVLDVGRYWIGMNEELYLFPVFQQTYSWTKDPHEGSPHDESLTFQTKEGLSINLDMGISYSIDKDKISILFQKYRKGVEELTDVVLRNSVRSYLNKEGAKYSVEEAYSTKKVELIKSVLSQVKDEYKDKGILIDDLYLIGNMRLPENVLHALNAKVEATQRAMQAENEVAQAKAQAEKLIAEAKGIAESNRVQQQTITPELIKYEAVKKWNGVLPHVTSGATPFIDLKDLK